MTDRTLVEMKSACHAMAEHILRKPCHGNRCKWLREQVSIMLKDENYIKDLTARYSENYQYAEVPTAYLAEILKLCDDWTD